MPSWDFDRTFFSRLVALISIINLPLTSNPLQPVEHWKPLSRVCRLVSHCRAKELRIAISRKDLVERSPFRDGNDSQTVQRNYIETERDMSLW